MNPAIGIFIVLLFMGIIGGAIFMVVRTYKQTGLESTDPSVANLESTHDFLPFKNIQNRVIDLGGHEYRAIIECNSVNYALKTGAEQDAIEASFQRFLNSLSFPITIFIQTRIIDNSKMLKELEEELKNTVKDNPQMYFYAESYLNDMHNLYSEIGNNKQKKKYIIVNYNEANNIPNMSDAEKYEYSLSELDTRVRTIISSLHPVGIKGKRLDTREIVELIHSCYHKENYGHIENATDDEFLSMIVDGENHEENMTNDEKMDFILYQAQMNILKDVIHDDMSSFLKEEYSDIVEQLGKIRESVGSPYDK